MINKIAILATAGVFMASVASAQTNTPPPGNVNPGSMNSGAEATGAENQPRSTGGQKGTTGSGMTAPGKAMKDSREGIRGSVNPGSQEADVPSGQPAAKPR